MLEIRRYSGRVAYMKKIALVNQRYGLEVNGGSEYYTRLIAEKLVGIYEVHVITTKAIDYMTWEDTYTADEEIINGVHVHRFSVDYPRNQKLFEQINQKIREADYPSTEEEEQWAKAQGPVSSALIEYIRENHDQYFVFIFITYLYYNTIAGLPVVEDKSILIPTAHDEPFIYFNIYKKIFNAPKAIIYLTEEEKSFVNRVFYNSWIRHETTAIGMTIPDELHPKEFCDKLGIKDYVIYVGRIDINKGCNILFQYFLEYKRRNPGNLKLVLMGKKVFDIPKSPDIINLGFVSEKEKFDGIAGAKALILPSPFESLSISALEALGAGTPVIVNGYCEVLKGHCIRSNAGLYYQSFFEFEGCLNYILNHKREWNCMSRQGLDYIHDNYRWDVVLKKFEDLIESVGKKGEA